MAENATAPAAESRSRSKTASPQFTIVETKEPTYSVSPRNPMGDILTVRTPMIVYTNDDGTINEALTASATFDLFKALVELIIGAEWPDSVRMYLASFDPAVVQMIRDGASVEEAFDIKDPTAAQAAAYKRLSTPAASRSGGGKGGGGGGTPDNLLDLVEMAQDAYEALPKSFIAELGKGTNCPHCGGWKFWDNRGSDKGGPKFSCANKDCGGGGQKSSGGNFPWGWFGSQQGQGGGGGGGGRGQGGGGGRRSRGD